MFGLKPIPMTAFYLNHLCEGLICRHSHIPRSWGSDFITWIWGEHISARDRWRAWVGGSANICSHGRCISIMELEGTWRVLQHTPNTPASPEGKLRPGEGRAAVQGQGSTWQSQNLSPRPHTGWRRAQHLGQRHSPSPKPSAGRDVATAMVPSEK